MDTRYAIIADIVGSRTLTNRLEAQEIFENALNGAAEGLQLLHTPYATVGDEFQAVASSLEDALLFTLRAQLLLPRATYQLRFGIGVGSINDLSESSLQDGPGWWAARSAINHAHELQNATNPYARTWLITHEEVGTNMDVAINALLVLRDHAALKLSARHRRMTASLLMGKTQMEIARAEKVSQQAVSDFARGGGAGLLQSSLIIAEAPRA